MKTEDVQKQFSHYLHECTTNSKSADKYLNALKKVSQTISKLAPEINDVWEIQTVKEAEHYKNLIDKDPDFIEYNKIKGNNMYSSAYQWFIYYLRAKEYFSNTTLEPATPKSPLDEPVQVIFFGAPGTGKSFKINEMCAMYENYRTTFHPDTDYASFVGSYKPITKKVPIYGFQGKPLEEKGELILEDRIVYR